MNLEIIDDPDDGLFQAIAVDGEFEGQPIGEIMYIRRPAYLDIYHTGVREMFEGQGLASKMAGKVLDFIKEKNVKIYPRCPYLAGYIVKHPEYEDLVYA